MWTTWRMILAATFLTSVAPEEHPIYPRFHGIAFNTSEALCVPAGPDPMNSRTYLNAWLQVYPGINEICFTCTLEGLRTCIQQRDLQNRDQCVFGTLCALPDNPQEARPQDTLNSNMDICGYYGLVEAPAVSLYVCFAPLPTRAPTTTRPEILPCPLQSRGPEGGLVLWNEGEIVYDNVKHEVVPVLIDISGIQVPRHCSEQVQNLYQMLERETIKRAIDAMGATHYRGNINTNTYRSKRGIINDMLTGLNTGDTMINSIDIQGLNSKIEQLKGVMKNILQRSLDQQAEQAFLGEAGAHIQLDGIAVLEAHARTINRLIDREREDTARVQQGQLCHAYGQWMVAQIRHNLDQVHRGEVPDWIDSAQLAQLADQKGVLDDRTLKGMTRVYPVIPDCEVSEGTGIGMVLLIPTVTQDAGPFPIFRIENIGVVRGNASLRYHITENMAISKHGIMSSVSLAGCKQRGDVTICPHPLRQGEAAECGFNRTQDCTLEIIPVDPHFARAGYGGRGRYCVATTPLNRVRNDKKKIGVESGICIIVNIKKRPWGDYPRENHVPDNSWDSHMHSRHACITQRRISGRCGLSKDATRYLVAMAVVNLLVVIIWVILVKINTSNLHIGLNLCTHANGSRDVIAFAAVSSSVSERDKLFDKTTPVNTRKYFGESVLYPLDSSKIFQ
ncbi:uncharacterized protein LOC144504743 [Mustelus asterias]